MCPCDHGSMARASKWNHNIRYHPLLLAAAPAGAQRALDVGCGEGTLARKLWRSIRHVSAIDVEEHSVALARAHAGASEIDYLVGDFLRHPFAPASFDFIVCVAALHHMDPGAALGRMAELLRPGGTLAVLGLARSSYPADLPRDLAAVIAGQLHRLSQGWWNSPAPTIWPPAHTYGEVRVLAAASLAGARFHRHLLWRYSLVWSKPSA